MHFIHLFQKKFLSSCVLFFLIINCEYYKAYKHNEEGIKEFNETKLDDSKTSFHKSISYSYKSYIPTYNSHVNPVMQFLTSFDVPLCPFGLHPQSLSKSKCLGR